jgi:hypothetical protein
MSPFLFLSLLVPLASQSNASDFCNIETIDQGSTFLILAKVVPFETGALTYKINTTTITGSNKSRSINGGEIEILKNTTPILIWRGLVGTSSQTRTTVLLEGKLNDKTISCSANLP